LEEDRPLELLEVIDHRAPLGPSDSPRRTDAAGRQYLDAQWYVANLSIPHCTCLWFFHQILQGRNVRGRAHTLSRAIELPMPLMGGNAPVQPKKE
jgi:hypothetical protein